VPAVASNVGGLPEAVESGKTGFLVSNGDFTTPVGRLLEDRVLAARMSQAARERVQREFSVERMVAETVSAYREVLE
jgi:glycosyltransferase involved in cell wall biosynthesis